MLVRNMAVVAALLGSFAVVGTGLVAVTHHLTEDQIAENERQALLRRLNEVIPPSYHDNEIYEDKISVISPEFLGSTQPVAVYRARKDGKPIAAVLAPVAPDGYNGAIKLLVAVTYDGTIIAVRVVSQNETPGLGDGIEIERSKWIEAFSGRSLIDPRRSGWRVKRDGGIFDQLTGATITPRAVVKAVHKSLVYFTTHREALFKPIETDDGKDSDDGNA